MNENIFSPSKDSLKLCSLAESHRRVYRKQCCVYVDDPDPLSCREVPHMIVSKALPSHILRGLNFSHSPGDARSRNLSRQHSSASSAIVMRVLQKRHFAH